MHSLSLLLPLTLPNEFGVSIHSRQTGLVIKVHLCAGIRSSEGVLRIICHPAAAVRLLIHLHELSQYDVLRVLIIIVSIILITRLHQKWCLSGVQMACLQELVILGVVVGVLDGMLL